MQKLIVEGIIYQLPDEIVILDDPWHSPHYKHVVLKVIAIQDDPSFKLLHTNGSRSYLDFYEVAEVKYCLPSQFEKLKAFL